MIRESYIKSIIRDFRQRWLRPIKPISDGTIQKPPPAPPVDVKKKAVKQMLDFMKHHATIVDVTPVRSNVFNQESIKLR